MLFPLLAEPPMHSSKTEFLLFVAMLLFIYVLVPALTIGALFLGVRALMNSRAKPRAAMWIGLIGFLLTGGLSLMFGRDHVGLGRPWIDATVYGMPLIFAIVAVIGWLRGGATRRAGTQTGPPSP